MEWYQLLNNPKAISSLYSQVPKLENLELFSILFARDGSEVQLKANLDAFPDHPSPRWHQDFNWIQIEFSFWGVLDFEAKGWQPLINIDFYKEKNGKLNVSLSNTKNSFKYSFVCEFFVINRVTPYQRIIEKFV